MSRRGFILIGLLVIFSLGIGIWWTVRLSPPSPTPWWWGKNPQICVEVWEPGKDMATFAMRMKKSVFDSIIAVGLPAVIEVNEGKKFHLNEIWKKLERLPRGEKLKYEQEGSTITVWIEAGG